MGLADGGKAFGDRCRAGLSVVGEERPSGVSAGWECYTTLCQVTHCHSRLGALILVDGQPTELSHMIPSW